MDWRVKDLVQFLGLLIMQWGSEYDAGSDLLVLVAVWGLSCGDLVFVREAAEDLFPADLVLGEVDQLRRPAVSLSWCELAKSTVRPGAVCSVPGTW